MRSVGEHRADRAAAQDVALDPQHGEIRRLGAASSVLVAGLDVDDADAVCADLAGEPAAGVDRDHAARDSGRCAGCRTGTACRRRVVRPLPAAGAAAGEVEHAAAFEEEVALLGKEQAEPRQVDLLLVDLDLREVGVVR